MKSIRKEENANLPVIMVHCGNQKYLKLSIKCAEKHGTPVFLIGDNSNKKFEKNWVHIDELSNNLYSEFLSIYRHMSANSEQFELVCFQRYFVMYEFMKRKNMKYALMQDSDNLLFRNFKIDDFYGNDVALCWSETLKKYVWSVSAHFSFWTICALEEFLLFVIDIYKSHIDILLEKYKYHQHLYETTGDFDGGVCDMTLLYLWVKESERRVSNLCLLENQSVYDRAINVCEFNGNKFKYNSYAGIKCVKFRKGNPYFINEETYELIKAPIIQANGSTKMYMRLWTHKISNQLIYTVWRFCYNVKKTVCGNK